MNGTGEAKVSLPAAAAAGVVASASGTTAVAQTRRAVNGTAESTLYAVFYYVPDVKYYVKSVEETYNSQGVRVNRDTETLVSFKEP
jgi:hypothetical protein